MTKETIQEYAELEAEKRKIDARQKEIKEDVASFMQDSGHDKVDGDSGSFLIVRRKTWKYTDRVQGLLEEVKAAKHEEEAKGPDLGGASFTENVSVSFYPKKDE